MNYGVEKILDDLEKLSIEEKQYVKNVLENMIEEDFTLDDAGSDRIQKLYAEGKLRSYDTPDKPTS